MSQTQALESTMRTFSAAAVDLARALDDDDTPGVERSVEFWPPLGRVQRRIVVLDGMSGADGMRVEEIARRANRPGGPSTLVVLDTLHRRGIVEPLPGDRYRLTPGYRRRRSSSGDHEAAPIRRASARA